MRKKPDEREREGDELCKKIQNCQKRRELWDRAAEEHLRYKSHSYLDLADSAKIWRELEKNNSDWRELWKEAEQHIKRMVQLSGPDRIEESKREINRKLEKGLSYEDIGNELMFQNRLKVAAAFEERYKRAFREKDHAFIRRLAKAHRLQDDKISLTPRAPGLVLVAWRELGGLDFSGTRPTKRKIRLWVENCYKKGGLPPLADKTWDRVWEDQFIAALFRD